MRRLVFCLSILTACCASTAAAQTKAPATADPLAHTQLAPDDLDWMPVPPVFLPGAQMAVLRGDPSKEGIFILRIKFPANYKIMPHWHPTAESFTVLNGEVDMGMGDKFDKSMAKPVPTHGFVSIPALHHHFVWVPQPATIDLVGYGPFQLYYVNPKDSPQAADAK